MYTVDLYRRVTRCLSVGVVCTSLKQQIELSITFARFQ